MGRKHFDAKLLAALRDCGAVLDRKTNHYVWRLPNGAVHVREPEAAGDRKGEMTMTDAECDYKINKLFWDAVRTWAR